MFRLTIEGGGKRTHVNKFHVICVEWVRKPKSSYSTLWVNGAYVSNFDSTASFVSDQKLTLGNIIDGDVPFLGAITAMEIYAVSRKGCVVL